MQHFEEIEIGVEPALRCELAADKAEIDAVDVFEQILDAVELLPAGHNVSNEIAGTERIDIYGRLAFGSFPSPEAEGQVLYMETTRRSIRTASGLGVGTRKPRLERELPSLRCYRHLCSVVASGGLQRMWEDMEFLAM